MRVRCGESCQPEESCKWLERFKAQWEIDVGYARSGRLSAAKFVEVKEQLSRSTLDNL
jgi:hypothetical protein